VAALTFAAWWLWGPPPPPHYIDAPFARRDA